MVIVFFAISTSAIFVKLISDAPAGMIAFYRLFLAVILMAPIVFFKYKSEFKNISKKDWMLAAISGVFLSLHFILRSEEHTSELQSRGHLVCRLLLEKTNLI